MVDEALASGVTWWRFELVVRGSGALSWWCKVVEA